MMEFASDKPIYRQIVDFCYEQVLGGVWAPASRMPSVREMAASMAVNTHTILKACEIMESAGVIAARRGMGFFITENAPELIREARRADFYSSVLPAIKKEMALLGITPQDLLEHLEN